MADRELNDRERSFLSRWNPNPAYYGSIKIQVPKEDDMATDNAGKILDAVTKVAPIVFEWVFENFVKLAKGKMTPQEVREALSPVADTEQRAAALDAILNSEELAEAYQRAADVLDTD